MKKSLCMQINFLQSRDHDSLTGYSAFSVVPDHRSIQVTDRTQDACVFSRFISRQKLKGVTRSLCITDSLSKKTTTNVLSVILFNLWFRYSSKLIILDAY